MYVCVCVCVSFYTTYTENEHTVMLLKVHTTLKGQTKISKQENAHNLTGC